MCRRISFDSHINGLDVCDSKCLVVKKESQTALIVLRYSQGNRLCERSEYISRMEMLAFRNQSEYVRFRYRKISCVEKHTTLGVSKKRKPNGFNVF